MFFSFLCFIYLSTGWRLLGPVRTQDSLADTMLWSLCQPALHIISSPCRSRTHSEKTSQAFRDALHEHYRSSKKSKHEKRRQRTRAKPQKELLSPEIPPLSEGNIHDDGK